MRSLAARITATGLIVASSPASGHGGHVHGLAPGWTWDPWITLPLGAVLVLYGIGLTRLCARAARADYRGRALLFGAGWILLAGALVSPLHEAGERSFAAHMVEHELLMLAAAPLLVLSQPLVMLLWSLPAPLRRAMGAVAGAGPVATLWDGLTAPVAATVMQAAALWLWHAPALFDLALASEAWHAVQHLSFIASALLFWTAMIAGSRARRPGGPALAAFCLFATSLISGALGALMAFSQSPWYSRYAELGMAPFGLTPAEDQQVAGLIMWIPGGLVHAAAALALVSAMLRRGQLGSVDAA